MTRKEFDKLYLEKAVHCDTEEKANEFLALADSVGYKWLSGRSLIEENMWETYEEETCYLVIKDEFMFCSIDFYKIEYIEIIEYQLQPKFKVGDKVRVKDALYAPINGKIGVIESVNLLSSTPYAVEINDDDDEKWIWLLTENNLEKIEEPTYKVGDKVRVKDASYTRTNGKVGVVESVSSSSPMLYYVKIDSDDIHEIRCIYETQLEKVEEIIDKEETIDDIIKEIKEYQKRITVLLNRLEQEIENKQGKKLK